MVQEVQSQRNTEVMSILLISDQEEISGITCDNSVPQMLNQEILAWITEIAIYLDDLMMNYLSDISLISLSCL
jgi:hypothetical protein